MNMRGIRDFFKSLSPRTTFELFVGFCVVVIIGTVVFGAHLDSIDKQKAKQKKADADAKFPHCTPKFKVGDLVDSVMPNPGTNRHYRGLIQLFKGTSTENYACVYMVIHYGSDGTSGTYRYHEFELKEAVQQ